MLRRSSLRASSCATVGTAAGGCGSGAAPVDEAAPPVPFAPVTAAATAASTAPADLDFGVRAAASAAARATGRVSSSFERRVADFFADFFADLLADVISDFFADFFADPISDFISDFFADFLADFFADCSAIFLAGFCAPAPLRAALEVASVFAAAFSRAVAVLTFVVGTPVSVWAAASPLDAVGVVPGARVLRFRFFGSGIVALRSGTDRTRLRDRHRPRQSRRCGARQLLSRIARRPATAKEQRRAVGSCSASARLLCG